MRLRITRKIHSAKIIAIATGTCNNSSRKRKIIWFDPPFNFNFSTNMARTFSKLIDRHFPRFHKLDKIFSEKIIRVSYSCIENITEIATKITKSNKKKNKTVTVESEKITPSTVVEEKKALFKNIPPAKEGLFRTDGRRV